MMRRIALAALAMGLPFTAQAAAPDVNPWLIDDPGGEVVDAVWPPEARQRGVEGKVVLKCEVTAAGRAQSCAVSSETPGGQGFGAAALRLVPGLKFEPARSAGQAVPSSMTVPIWFSLPLDTPPDWKRKPTSDELQAAWPSAAARKGQNGRAVLQCVSSRYGTLEDCEVRWEDPPGMGFGAAAIALTPSFLMKPAMRNGQPVAAPVNIPINFKTFGSFSGAQIRLLTDPIWASAPTFADMSAAWPAKAKGPSGHVVMRCGFTPDGGLKDCEVLTEAPGAQGFARAAKSVASKFRLRVDDEVAPLLAKARVNLPIHFVGPSEAAARGISKPQWIIQVNPDKVVELFPAKAANAGIRSGRGIADCVVAADGRLADCKPGPATPPDLGFSEAAVAVASVMQMNPWSDGGGPVDGARIKLPVTFNLAEGEARPKP